MSRTHGLSFISSSSFVGFFLGRRIWKLSQHKTELLSKKSPVHVYPNMYLHMILCLYLKKCLIAWGPQSVRNRLRLLIWGCLLLDWSIIHLLIYVEHCGWGLLDTVTDPWKKWRLILCLDSRILYRLEITDTCW